MKKISALLFFIISISIYSQNLDSLFNYYVALHNNDYNIKLPQIQHANEDDRKCTFGLNGEIATHFNEFTPQQQSVLKQLLDRPYADTSIVSPSGFFRVHYRLDSWAPTYNPVDLAKALDSTYNYEVNYLGYLPPVSDNGEGGDDKYDVYISPETPADYGETKFLLNSQPSFIIIQNEFINTYTHGIDAARVTAAHEFHHAIQISNYGFFNKDTFFYELTSTAMEEFVFDDVNDYYGYIPSIFNNPNKTFTEIYTYSLALYYIYLQERFDKEEANPLKGHQIIKRAWELFANNKDAFYSLALALFEYGTTFEYEYNTFGIWCYFTGYRANPQLYFEEGEYYPLIRPLNGFVPYPYEPPRKEYQLQLNQISNNYLVFDVGDIDTLVSLITYADIEGFTNGRTGTASVKYILEKSETSSGKKIVNDFYSTIESSEIEFLKESNIFNNTIVSGGEFTREEVDFAFPQPFKYSASFNDVLNIPASLNSLGYADLNIYTTSMDLVYSDRLAISNGQKVVVKWNGRDESGKKLPTGIYIYVTKSDDTVKKGKLVIYNE